MHMDGLSHSLPPKAIVALHNVLPSLPEQAAEHIEDILNGVPPQNVGASGLVNGNLGEVITEDARKRRNGLRSAVNAQDAPPVSLGRLIHQFKQEDIDADALRSQYIALVTERENKKVEAGHITQEKADEKIARFTEQIDKIIANLTAVHDQDNDSDSD
jgi:hypothetical protein